MAQTTYEKEFTLQAWLRLGGEPVVLSGTLKGEDTVLKVRFETLSLEKIVNDLIRLVRPTFTLELPYPWDQILGFELHDLELSYNIKQKTIGFASDLKFDELKPLLELERVYIDAKSVHDVTIAFDGTLLGYAPPDGKRLGWNLVGADGPPAAPPPPSLFDLKFLGLGQRLRLTNAAQYEHVSDAIADMASLFDPPAEGALVPSFPRALVFDNNSNWLFGLDAEIMDTVALSIVFNDPGLYGLFVGLKGEKAKSLDGLEFEILYKKITDDIGVYQAELKLPATIRSMEFGAVSVTLPQIGVDIYTNGNFKIDFGFPRNLVFTNSFAVQMFPFVGFGGFYFAVLNGATSSTLPVTSNGTFNPVLEFGIGLQLGVGKTIDKGILQASATLTYAGVVEGTLAWFEAYPSKNIDENLPDFYYRLNGTFAIVGKIWGGVKFSIVSASLDLTVYASAMVVIEASEPIRLTFSAGVSVSLRVSVDLGLFTIHVRLSFHTVVSYQFLIGSPSGAQWKPQAVLPQSPATVGAQAGVLERLTDDEKNRLVQLDWNAVFADDRPYQVDLYYFTQFSIADQVDSANEPSAVDANPRVVGIGMLFAPIGDGPASHETLSSREVIHRHLPPFEQIAIAALCWTINASLPEAEQADSLDELLNGAVTQVRLANILYSLDHDEQELPVSYAQIIELLKPLFIFNIRDTPFASESGEEKNQEPLELNLGLFPMIPDLFFKPQDHQERRFADMDNEVDPVELIELVNRYAMIRQGGDGPATGFDSEGLATLLFRDYFKLLIKTLVQSALDAMEVFKYEIPAAIDDGDELVAPTLARITGRFTTEDVSAADIGAIAVSNQNNISLLRSGARLRVPGIRYSIQSNDSIAEILTGHGLLDAGEDIGDDLVRQLVELNRNAELFVGGRSIGYRDSEYELEDGDTLNRLIESLSPDARDIPGLVNSLKDRTDILQVFKRIKLPTIEREIEAAEGEGAETLLDIANRYRVDLRALAQENRDNADILRPEAKIIIENVRSLNLAELISYLSHDGALGHAAGAASRFFLYGMRLPLADNPGDNNAKATRPMYHLSGQQFVFDFATEEKTGALSHDRVILSKLPGGDGSKDDDRDPLPWIRFNAHQAKPPANLVHTFLPEEIEIARAYAGAGFEPTIERGPLSIKLYNDQLKTYPLSNPIAWQRETASPETGAASIWMFPPNLRAIRHETPTLRLMVGTQPQKNAAMRKEEIDERNYTWSTLLPVTIRRVNDDHGNGEIGRNSYEVYGTDAAGIELLTALVTRTGDIETTHILFPSNPETNEARALQSYGDDTLTLLINTNLSTETNPDILGTNAGNGQQRMGTSPADMAVRLWKSSLVRTGGYYLYVRNAEGRGLPDKLFNGEETTDIFLLINYQETTEIQGYMNSVCLRQPVNGEHSVLFAEWAVAQDAEGRIIDPERLVKERKIARIPAIQPGNAGFKLVRTNPNRLYPEMGKNGSPKDRFRYQLETQYNLLDFEVVDNEVFENKGPGLAVSPEKDHKGEDYSEPTTNEVRPTDLTGPWKYRRALPLANVIKQLPEPTTAYLGLNQRLELRFAWRDNFGNRLQHGTEDGLQLAVDIRYFDYLVPLSQWPHTDISYEFIADTGATGNFRINFLFHPASEYVVTSHPEDHEDYRAEISALMDKVDGDLSIFEKSLDQIRQQDVDLSFTVSLDPGIASGFPEAADRRAGLKFVLIDQFLDPAVKELGGFLAGLKRVLEDTDRTIPEIHDIACDWTEEVADTNGDDIFPLEVEFSIERDRELIDPAFEHVPEVRCVRTLIKPRSEARPIGLGRLAERFEALYPGAKITTAYTKGKQQQELWIVRIRPQGEDKKPVEKGMSFDIRYDQASFYAPQPLTTHLVSLSDVPIQKHGDYGINPAPEPLAHKTFSMVDPETWARAYLETLEETLRPEFSLAITMFDSLSGESYLGAILGVKQKVADAIALQTVPILDATPGQSEGHAVAREKIRQQLLVNLVDGYQTNAVVQYDVDVISGYPDDQQPIAPNLFGQPLSNPGDVQPREAPTYSLSTGKIALNGTRDTPARSYLTFLFNTDTERYRSEIPLDMAYGISHLEFDIRSLDGAVDPLVENSIKNYSVSKWLSFVKPLVPISGRDATTRIPVPIRQYPGLPNLGAQQFAARDEAETIADLQKAKQIDYRFSYRLPEFTAQDTVHCEILFNSKKAEEEAVIRLAKPTDALDRLLHQSLAQFHEAREPMLDELRSLLPRVNMDMQADSDDWNRLNSLLSSYRYLSEQVASLWFERFSSDIHTSGDRSLKVITAKFDLVEDEDPDGESFRITMTNYSIISENTPVRFVALPFVHIEDYQVEARGFLNDDDRLQAIDGSGGNRYREWNRVFFRFYKIDENNERKYLSFADGKQRLDRSIEFAELDVLQVQNAWAGYNVVRNAGLSEGKATAEAFVYRTPLKRFANPVTPLLDIADAIDLTSPRQNQPLELTEVLISMVESLLEPSAVAAESAARDFQPSTLKIVTSYSFTSNPDVGAILQPCFLVPPTRFDERDTTPDGAGIRLLQQGIIDWFSAHRPVQTGGRLYFDITFYSLLADDDLPVLRLRQLYIEVEKIATLQRYAG